MGEAITTVQSRAVERAAEVVGGVEELAAHLGLAAGTIRLFMGGRMPVPQQVFLKVVDIISAADGAPKPS